MTAAVVAPTEHGSGADPPTDPAYPGQLTMTLTRRELLTGIGGGALAVGGYLFFLGMYVSLAVSVPPALQEDSPGAVGAFLYSLPTVAAAVPPVVAVVGIYLAHRWYR